MGMNVNLTPQLEDLVRQKVASGLYTSASEVVREALRLMDEKDRLLGARLDQLRKDIREGLESGPATSWDPKKIKREGRARMAARRIQVGASMPIIIRRPRASADIGEIWEFIAENSVVQADEFVDRIDAKFQTLAAQPDMGRERNELESACEVFRWHPM